MPGPWIERRGQAFEQTTEWYESNLVQNTEYEIELSLNEDYSSAETGSFRTVRTDYDVTLRSVTILHKINHLSHLMILISQEKLMVLEVEYTVID